MLQKAKAMPSFIVELIQRAAGLPDEPEQIERLARAIASSRTILTTGSLDQIIAAQEKTISERPGESTDSELPELQKYEEPAPKAKLEIAHTTPDDVIENLPEALDFLDYLAGKAGLHRKHVDHLAAGIKRHYHEYGSMSNLRIKDIVKTMSEQQSAEEAGTRISKRPHGSSGGSLPLSNREELITNWPADAQAAGMPADSNYFEESGMDTDEFVRRMPLARRGPVDNDPEASPGTVSHRKQMPIGRGGTRRLDPKEQDQMPAEAAE